MKKILQTILLIAAVNVSAASQNILSDTLVWESTNVRDNSNSTQFELISKFISYGDNKIEWIQSGNSVVKTFHIENVTGSWENINNNGQATFNIDMEGGQGTIVFKKLNDEKTVVFSFSRNGAETMPFKFIINSVQPKTKP